MKHFSAVLWHRFPRLHVSGCRSQSGESNKAAGDLRPGPGAWARWQIERIKLRASRGPLCRPLNYFKNSIRPILSECLSVQIKTPEWIIKARKCCQTVTKIWCRLRLLSHCHSQEVLADNFRHVACRKMTPSINAVLINWMSGCNVCVCDPGKSVKIWKWQLGLNDSSLVIATSL